MQSAARLERTGEVTMRAWGGVEPVTAAEDCCYEAWVCFCRVAGALQLTGTAGLGVSAFLGNRTMTGGSELFLVGQIEVLVVP